MRRRVVTAFDLESSGPDRPALDVAEFSRFKHGASAPAWRFGRQLMRRLVAECADLVHAERLVVTASCYKVVPLASVALGRVVAHRLNRERRDKLLSGSISPVCAFAGHLDNHPAGATL